MGSVMWAGAEGSGPAAGERGVGMTMVSRVSMGSVARRRPGGCAFIVAPDMVSARRLAGGDGGIGARRVIGSRRRGRMVAWAMCRARGSIGQMMSGLGEGGTGVVDNAWLDGGSRKHRGAPASIGVGPCSEKQLEGNHELDHGSQNHKQYSSARQHRLADGGRKTSPG